MRELANQNKHATKQKFSIPQEILDFPASRFVTLEPLDGQDGKVFKSFDKISKIFVALKSVEADSIEEYINEHESLKIINDQSTDILLKHWGTFKDYSAQKKEGKVFLKYSLELGLADLNSLLLHREKYSENEIFFILKDLGAALQLLKEKNICHGNICAENVVLFPKNSWFTYKLVDFGFSYKVEKIFSKEKEKEKEMEKDKEKDFFYNVNGISENYASPELKKLYNDQIKDPSFDPFKADIYALGVLSLFLMGKTSAEVVGIQNDLSKLDDEKEFNELKNLIKKMLAIKVDDRCTIDDLFANLNTKTITPPIEHLFIHKIRNKNLDDLKAIKDSVKFHQYLNFDEGNSSLGMNLVYVGNDNKSFW